MACAKYYAYTDVGKPNHAQLLAAHGNGDWKNWFAPYGPRIFPIDQAWLGAVNDVDDYGRWALVVSGCSSAINCSDVVTHLRRVTIPPQSMNDWGITCLPPDPKLPPATHQWPPPYSRDEFKAMVYATKAAATATPPTPYVERFYRAILAAEECASKGRFAGIVTYMKAKRAFDAVAVRMLASIFEIDRASPTCAELNSVDRDELRIVQAMAAAVPPCMPRPAEKLAAKLFQIGEGKPSDYEKMSDHREWQFRLFAALLDVSHLP